ncbi:NUDIX hydrolase [Actinoalloteichus caeruleus]
MVGAAHEKRARTKGTQGAGRDYYYDESGPGANSIAPAVTAVVRNWSGHFLIIRRTDNDLYAIPGETQGIGETISQTVVREVEEETGITVVPRAVTGICTDPNHVVSYSSDGRFVRNSPSASLPTRCLGACGPAVRARRYSGLPEELMTLNIHPAIRLRIDHALGPHARSCSTSPRIGPSCPPGPPGRGPAGAGRRPLVPRCSVGRQHRA